MSAKPPIALFPKPPANALVCIVDDDESIRRSLERLFRSVRLAAAAFPTAKAFLAQVPHERPFCLVLDVQMPELSGLELQQVLAHREAQIVFLTGHGDVPTCAGAMRAGAVDFLTKPVDEEELLAAVGRALVSSAAIYDTKARRSTALARLDALTPREFEVMQRVMAGLLNKQIASELGAAEKTIKIHRGRVMEKLGVSSVAELIRVAESAGVTAVGMVGR